MKKKLHIITLFVIAYISVMGLVFVTYIILDNQQSKKEKDVASIVTERVIVPSITAPQGKKLSVHGTIPYWEQEEATATFRNNVSSFDHLSLFWYTLNSNQKIVPYKDAEEDESIITFAREGNVKVHAVITNLPDFEGSEWDSQLVRQLIATPQARAAHIQDIISLLDAKKFDGVNIDYEELDTDLKDEFSIFIKELSRELHLRGKLVGVAIHPKSGEFIPSEDNGSRAQDWQSLGQHADQLYFMTYGEHWNDSAAGPIASIPWDSKILAYAQRLQVPKEKIYLGTPLYGVRWQVGSKQGEGLLYSDIRNIFQQYTLNAAWNDLFQSPSFQYTEGGTNYVVWFENARSVKEKIELAEQNGIGGISFWHIGDEDPEVWNVLHQENK